MLIKSAGGGVGGGGGGAMNLHPGQRPKAQQIKP